MQVHTEEGWLTIFTTFQANIVPRIWPETIGEEKLHISQNFTLHKKSEADLWPKLDGTILPATEREPIRAGEKFKNAKGFCGLSVITYLKGQSANIQHFLLLFMVSASRTRRRLT